MSDLTADELLKRGDKKMMTTLTRWKPDYEAAAAAYEEAGSKFRAKGRTKDAICLLYTSPSPRDKRQSRMPSSA